MSDDYKFRVFPPPLPVTPAGRMAQIHAMLNPVDEDGNPLPPLISMEDALRLMDMPDMETAKPVDPTPKVRHIMYTGEYVEPDAYDNLAAEMEAAVYALTHRPPNITKPVIAALERFVNAVGARLGTTSDRSKP